MDWAHRILSDVQASQSAQTAQRADAHNEKMGKAKNQLGHKLLTVRVALDGCSL